MDEDLDRIDRRIDIDADAERVWELVTRPGWYVNQGTVISNPVLETDGGLTLLRHPEYGDFRFRTVTLQRPRYAAFRWLGEQDQSTLVEFWITDRDGSGVTLRVVESGLSRLDDPDWLRKREENVEGWESELVAAAAYAGRSAVVRAVDVAASPTQVWPLLTTADGLARWLSADFAPAAGTPSTPTGPRGTTVVELARQDARGGAPATLTVAAAGAGSTVTVRQRVPGDEPADPLWTGWERALQRLADLATRDRVPV